MDVRAIETTIESMTVMELYVVSLLPLFDKAEEGLVTEENHHQGFILGPTNYGQSHGKRTPDCRFA